MDAFCLHASSNNYATKCGVFIYNVLHYLYGKPGFKETHKKNHLSHHHDHCRFGDVYRSRISNRINALGSINYGK